MKESETIRLYFNKDDKKLWDAIKKLAKDEDRSDNKTCKLVLKKGLRSLGYYTGE